MGALPGAAALQAASFTGEVSQQLPALLQLLEQIRQQPSDTAPQVKAKQELYRRFDRARAPFRQLAELWCSKYAEGEGDGLADELSAIAPCGGFDVLQES